jgi:hypothetical protein
MALGARSPDARLARARQRATASGMHFIAAACADDQVRRYLGTGLLYSLRSLARSSADAQLRSWARGLGRQAFRTWEQACLQAADPQDSDWVGDAVRGYAAGTGLGLRRDAMRPYLRRAARRFDATTLIGFDARLGPPPAHQPGAFRIWCVGLTSAWCGERFGVPLGARYGAVLRWLPAMRDYHHAWSGAPGRFEEVAYAVTHVVYTLNDYGECLLDPRWLPDEYLFLRAALPVAIANGDADLAAELLDTLRAFGVADADPLVRSAYRFLIDTQNADGSWGRFGARTFYTGFHATWAAVDGLRDYRWTGPRLAFPELLPRLQSWSTRR